MFGAWGFSIVCLRLSEVKFWLYVGRSGRFCGASFMFGCKAKSRKNNQTQNLRRPKYRDASSSQMQAYPQEAQSCSELGADFVVSKMSERLQCRPVNIANIMVIIIAIVFIISIIISTISIVQCENGSSNLISYPCSREGNERMAPTDPGPASSTLRFEEVRVHPTALNAGPEKH